MILFKKSADIRQYLKQLRTVDTKVGWVPTLGALHEGHLSLLESARANNDFIICSIFVNPTQFNVAADFAKYPVTIENDIRLLDSVRTDCLFLPTVDEIYPTGMLHLEHYPLGWLEQTLEGEFRPGHFQGVCQVMSRLTDIIAADHLYMGQKDYQQCMVIQKLLEFKKSGTILHTCPTRREKDGLAMSSRNMRLSPAERKDAIGIYECLTYLKEYLKPGPLSPLIEHARSILLDHHFKIDYVSVTDAFSLQPVNDWNSKQELVALVAAFQDEVRLIDNIVLTPSRN